MNKRDRSNRARVGEWAQSARCCYSNINTTLDFSQPVKTFRKNIRRRFSSHQVEGFLLPDVIHIRKLHRCYTSCCCRCELFVHGIQIFSLAFIKRRAPSVRTFGLWTQTFCWTSFHAAPNRINLTRWNRVGSPLHYVPPLLQQYKVIRCFYIAVQMYNDHLMWSFNCRYSTYSIAKHRLLVTGCSRYCWGSLTRCYSRTISI